MKEHMIKTYSFAELSEQVQQTAIDNLRDINVDYEWWDFIYSDAIEIGALMGIDIENIYFSGFSYQGDGAQFAGSYAYKRGGVKAVKEYAPQDKELHRIATTLQEIQKTRFYQLSAVIRPNGNYCHEYCTDIDVYDDKTGDYADDEMADEIRDLLRDFMRWIYAQLEKEYRYLVSDEAIRETIEANDYDFLPNGKIY